MGSDHCGGRIRMWRWRRRKPRFAATDHPATSGNLDRTGAATAASDRLHRAPPAGGDQRRECERADDDSGSGSRDSQTFGVVFQRASPVRLRARKGP